MSLHKKVNKYLLWLFGLTVTFFVFIGGYAVETYKQGATHLSKEEAHNIYLTNDKFFIHSKFQAEQFKRALLMRDAGARDTMLIESFEHYDYMIEMFFGDEWRTTDSQSNVSDILNQLMETDKY